MSLTEETTLDRPELQNERLKIPSMAEDEIKAKVTGLNKSFTKLLQSLKKELKEKDVDVTEIVEYLEDSGCDHLPFDDLKTSNNFRELLTKVGDYYDFLDCELLKMIAEEYASEELAKSFEAHSSEAQKFRESNSVCQLKESLQNIFNPYVDDLEKGPKAHIDLNNAWNKLTLDKLSVLIRCFFPNTDRHALTRHINVTCSSVHITYFMTESPDEIQQVIAWAKERVAFMKYIGLYRLVINGETILDESEKEDFSFNSALIEAARVGQSEAVEVLLQLGSGSDVLGNISQALLDACDNGHYQVVKLLLDKKADSNVKKECGRTALYLASRNGHHKVVELLIKAKADPNIQSLEGVTPLYMASQNGHPQVVELFLQEKADTNIKVIASGKTALMAASHCGHIKIVELLLKEKVNPNVQEYDGWTALMLASLNGHHQVVELLLNANADPNIKEDDGWTALMLASEENHYQAVKLLLEGNADPNIKQKAGGTALIIACQNGFQEVAKLLLKQNADPNIEANTGRTALMQACMNGRRDVVELLLHNEKVNSNKQESDGWTALMLACLGGHQQVVELLLEKKASPKIQGYDGITALMAACLRGNQHVVELLLNKEKVDPDIQKNDGRTALMMASIRGYHRVVELLLKANADPNIKKNDGWTALMIASQEGHYQVVRLLLERNADPNIMSENGCTAIVIASQNGHLPVVELLFKENADPNLQNGGRTALVLASLNNRKDVVSFLIKEQKDHGLTALMSAIYSKHIDIVLLLLETGIMTYVDQAHIQAAIKFSMMHSNTEITELLRYYATEVHSFSEEDLSSKSNIIASWVEPKDIYPVHNTLPYNRSTKRKIKRLSVKDTDKNIPKNVPARYQKHSNQPAAGGPF